MDTQSNESKSGGKLGLIGILAGIVLGVAFGLAYGRTMWLASGGPQRKLDLLQQTIEQKATFAQQNEEEAEQLAAEGNRQDAQQKRQEAERLRSHVPLIRQELVQTQDVQARAAGTDHRVPQVALEITRFCGDVFLRMLLLMVIPLVFTSMVCGIGSLGDVRKLGKVGGWTICYYMLTGAAAVLLGIVLVQIIEPGKGTDDTFAFVRQNVLAKQDATVLGTLLQVVRGEEGDPASGMIPGNIFLAASRTNVLAVIAFALIFGGALSTLGEKGKVAIDFFHAVNDAVMKIIHLIMYFAPVGIFGLIATKITDSGGGSAFGDELARLGWYVATVMLGLAIHTVVLCLLLAVLARRNPVLYIYGVLRALLTAMSTASSTATLPVTMECVQENHNVSERAAGFVLPLGATINMDGTALYEAVATIFIAQSMGIPLSGAALVIVFLTATLASVGAPGIPEAGLVTMLIVLSAVGIPATGIGTILAIDWFLDRLRTTVNVYGDTVGAAVIDRYLESP